MKVMALLVVAVLLSYAQHGRYLRMEAEAAAPPPPPSIPYEVDTSRPSLRTNWTRFVPLTGRQGLVAARSVPFPAPRVREAEMSSYFSLIELQRKCSLGFRA